MNRKVVEIIKRRYDTKADEYCFNERYSNDERAVYVRPSNPYEWLTITERDKGHYMATRTDSNGIITNREIYKANEKGCECIHEERPVPKRKRVSIRERLEINKIRIGQKRLARDAEKQGKAENEK